MAKQHLTLQQAADLLGVSAKTVRRFIARGDLQAYRVGRQIRITLADVESLLQPISTVRSGDAA